VERSQKQTDRRGPHQVRTYAVDQLWVRTFAKRLSCIHVQLRKSYKYNLRQQEIWARAYAQ